ncbi:MAG: DUF2125 domain-containing protein [Pseudomonadota bacterium]
MNEPAPKRSRTLRYKILLVGVLLVVVAWSVLWFTAATVVDRQAEKAQHAAMEAGSLAHCQNRSVTGFPFRIEVRCDRGTRLGNNNAELTLGGFVGAALIYRPSRVIAEVQGPATFSANNMDVVNANWELAHASARLNLGGPMVDRFDLEVLGGDFTAGALQPVRFGDFDLNTRRSPAAPQDLDVAVRLTDLRPMPGTEPATLSIRGTLEDAAPVLAGHADTVFAHFLNQGLTFAIDALTFESGDMQVAAAGTVDLGANGYLNGTVDVAIAGFKDRLPYISIVSPETEATVTTLFKNVLMFAPDTSIGERSAKRLTLTITDGRVSAGIVPLFAIPRLPLALH